MNCPELECPWPRAPFQRVGFANNHSNSKKQLPSTGTSQRQLKMVQHAHVVYHDVLAKLLSKESWGVRESNDAGSANGPTISKHCKHVRISQDFLVSVGLAKWGLTRLGSPSI